MRSSYKSAYPVNGHCPVDLRYFSMTRFSKTCPLFYDTTGSDRASPVIAQYDQDIDDYVLLCFLILFIAFEFLDLSIGMDLGLITEKHKIL